MALSAASAQADGSGTVVTSKVNFTFTAQDAKQLTNRKLDAYKIADYVQYGTGDNATYGVQTADGVDRGTLKAALESATGKTVSETGDLMAWALAEGVDYLNDIQGFPDADIYPDLAAANAKLIVMHSVQGRGRATVEDVPPSVIVDRILKFFETRIAALERAGVAKKRLILDPGMGFFLSSNPETSLAVLRHLSDIKRAFGLPVLVGVSRKSFLRKITGRASAAGAATLSGELLAALCGADYIRTHDAGALADGLKVFRAAAA